MPRLSKKHKRKLKHQTLKSLTICLAVVTALITARTTYLISPLPFDDFQVWKESRMGYVFAAFLALLIVNIAAPYWAIRKEKLKAAAIVSVFACALPLIWLVTIFSLNFS